MGSFTWHHLCITFYLLFLEMNQSSSDVTKAIENYGCDHPMGMSDRRIKDSQLSANSYWGGGPTESYSGRLYQDGKGWCAAGHNGPLNSVWYQIDLLRLSRINGIILGAAGQPTEYIPFFKIEYRDSSNQLKYIMEDGGGEKEFVGHSSHASRTEQYVRTWSPVWMSLIKIHVLKKDIHLYNICSSFEILGCKGKVFIAPKASPTMTTTSQVSADSSDTTSAVCAQRCRSVEMCAAFQWDKPSCTLLRTNNGSFFQMNGMFKMI